MPRLRQRRTKKASWAPEELEKAVNAVKSGMGKRESSRKFGIPYSTLEDRIKNNDLTNPTLGRKATFSEYQESEIVHHCIYLANMFWDLTAHDLRRFVYEYAETNKIPHRFNSVNKLAGKDWFNAFMKRNPEIRLRKPKANLESTGLNEDSVSLFYRNLADVLEKYQFKPHRIYNVDETDVTTVQVPSTLMEPKGNEQLDKVVSFEHGKNVTVCCAISAEGSYIPPMFIFPRAKMCDQLKRNGPVGATYTCSQEGCMTEELFVEWLHHFKLHANCSVDNPALVVLDNHTSHCSLPAYQFCRKNGITMVAFPPHTSHKLQPLNLTVFDPLKQAYSDECSAFMTQHPDQKITFYDIAEIFNLAYLRIASVEKAQKGFQISGICPFNPNVFSTDDFVSATV